MGDIYENTPTSGEANRFVAMFDVLGFSEMVCTMSLADLIERYNALLVAGYNQTTKGKVVSRDVVVNRVPALIFSDTVVLCQSTSSREDVRWFFEAACGLLAESVRLKMPLRGGVAFGECFFGSTPTQASALIGKAVLDAHGMEQIQEWVGAAVHCSAVEQIKTQHGDLLARGDLVCEYEIPWKDPGLAGWTRHALDWRGRCEQEHLDALDEMVRGANDESARKKLINTIEFLQSRR
jgi:hypothetical protein